MYYGKILNTNLRASEFVIRDYLFRAVCHFFMATSLKGFEITKLWTCFALTAIAEGGQAPRQTGIQLTVPNIILTFTRTNAQACYSNKHDTP